MIYLDNNASAPVDPEVSDENTASLRTTTEILHGKACTLMPKPFPQSVQHRHIQHTSRF